MHHGKDLPESLKKIVEECNLGPTNKFPKGKLNKNDEGQIKIAIGIDETKEGDKTIVMNFGKPIAWIGFTAKDAYNLAQIFEKLADKIESETLTKSEDPNIFKLGESCEKLEEIREKILENIEIMKKRKK